MRSALPPLQPSVRTWRRVALRSLLCATGAMTGAMPGTVSASTAAASVAVTEDPVAERRTVRSRVPQAMAAEEGLLLEDFQRVDRPGAPTRRTTLRLWQDRDRLRVSVRAFDDDPSGIVAQQLRRDTEALKSDDHVAIVIDVEGKGRNAFLFAVNAHGAQYDSLIFDGGQERRDWDAIWHSEGGREVDGWSAEMSIPLSVLGVRGPAGAAPTSSWRFNAERWMPRGGERVRLAGARADQQVFALGDALPMEGLSSGAGADAASASASASAPWGLRIKPSLRLVSQSKAASETGRARTRLEPALELFHQSDAGLRTTAAFNIDFGDAEADERVVNLTRFELFREEKREFFLQDAGRFSFGGLSEMSPIPFYSRRIGLDAQGRAHSLDAGLKLTGEAAGFDFGAFGARVDGGDAPDDERAARAADVGVLRVSRSLGEHHRLGLIATRGNPDGTPGSALGGVDYQYLDRRVAGDKTLEAHGWLQASRNASLGRGRAMGFSVDYPNLGPQGYLALQRIDETFEPSLGYLSEAGVTRGEGSLGWWHATADGDHVTPGVDWNFRRRRDGAERSSLFNPEVELRNAAGDFILPELFFETDRVDRGYEPVPDVPIAPGRYSWHYAYLLAETARSRPLAAMVELRSGGYYDGHRDDQGLTLYWQPNPHWGLQAGGARNAIDLPSGRFTVRTATLRLDHTPHTRLSQNLLLQWDNVSRELGVSARMKWLWGPGRELIVALDRLQYTRDRRDLAPGRTQAIVKLVWNLDR